MSQMDDIKLGALILIPQKEGKASPLPLEHTAVNGMITGPVAQVTVTQKFGNPFDHPIELEYLFPLPDKGAVVNYEITIGERTIKADIKERETARQVYQQAVSQGKRASLLEQRRPNLFSIEIGNVQPNEKITTQLTYEDRLKFSDGSYEFVFPMGITPKYHAASVSHAEANAVDSPVELDDSKISPVEISLTVDAGVAVGEPRSRTHSVSITRKNDAEFSLVLDGKHIPNKDFVLAYVVAAENLQTGVWTSHDEDGSDTVLVTLLPPKLDISAEPSPREFIFVIDRSGSMSTHPMNQAKNALRASIRALGANDTFTIEAFDTSNEWFSKSPVAVTQENVNQADVWIEQIRSRGGTEILGALKEALAIPQDAERQRYYVFLTDGAVSAVDNVLQEIAANMGDARLFSFGIGSSVNRHLLNKMAEIGRGTADFMGNNDDIEGVMTRFQDKVSYPALMDIALEWQGAESWDSYPAVLPDVYAGEPLELTTRLARQGKVTLNVIGKRGGEKISMSVDIPKADDSNPTLKRIWARSRIESLQDETTRGGDSEKIRQQIISLGLANRLVTQYTSFVAVDSEITENEKDSEKVNVSVPLPDDLDADGFGLPQTGATVDYMMMSRRSPASPPIQNMKRRSMESFDGGIVNRIVGGMKSLLGGNNDDSTADKVYRAAPKQNAGANTPNFDDMSPEEMMRWMESLATRQGATEGFTTSADMDVPEAEPAELGDYVPYGWTEENWQAHLMQENQPPAPKFTSIDERIKWLARTQQVNGSWHNDAETTAVALIAFVRAGHTTCVGNYRQQVKKAAQWLMNWAQKEADNFNGFVPFVVVRALDELHQASGDFEVTDAIRDKLPQAASEVELAATGVGTTPSATAISTLDDLRIAALLTGAVSATVNGVDEHLLEAWLAVGKTE